MRTWTHADVVMIRCVIFDDVMIWCPVGAALLLLRQGIADVVETLLEDVDSYLDEASGKGANQQVRWAAKAYKYCTAPEWCLFSLLVWSNPVYGGFIYGLQPRLGRFFTAEACQPCTVIKYNQR